MKLNRIGYNLDFTGTPLEHYSPEAQKAWVKRFEDLQWALTFMERYEKKHGNTGLEGITDFKYIVVRACHFSEEEIDKLNVQFQGICKFIIGDER